MRVRGFLMSLSLVFAMGAGAPGYAQSQEDEPNFMLEEGMVIYRSGRYEEAISIWTVKADEEGDANAAYQLAVVYTDGQVTERDFQKAAKYLKIAAEKGDQRAQFDLGSFYDAGYGVQRNVAESFRWYRAAAEQGHDAAMFNTAMMYHDGSGTERDLVEAYRWLYLANQMGISGLGDVSLESIASQLPPEELKRAIKLARSSLK